MTAGSLTAHAGGVAEKKQRAAVDEAAAKAAADIKDCGKRFAVVFDWKAYDGLDWAKMGRNKDEYMPSEVSNLAELGKGIDRLCSDKDYRAALAKIGTIVYRSTNDESIRVKATITGSTMRLDNYSFGSTRSADDYETAAKAAL
ncbi:MAG TPA: hypothetical protein VLX92_29035 [Kofleriaceae bacterium]|nr:hypothetical protein [Kofleriaceae bacterium]